MSERANISSLRVVYAFSRLLTCIVSNKKESSKSQVTALNLESTKLFGNGSWIIHNLLHHSCLISWIPAYVCVFVCIWLWCGSEWSICFLLFIPSVCLLKGICRLPQTWVARVPRKFYLLCFMFLSFFLGTKILILVPNCFGSKMRPK